jgi:glycosyltransferase involved in cell wall biosynthesis
MNEIGGEGAVYVDPREAVALADAIACNASQLQRMRAQGLENAALYTSERMALGYIETYRRVIAARKAA